MRTRKSCQLEDWWTQDCESFLAAALAASLGMLAARRMLVARTLTSPTEKPYRCKLRGSKNASSSNRTCSCVRPSINPLCTPEFNVPT